MISLMNLALHGSQISFSLPSGRPSLKKCEKIRCGSTDSIRRKSAQTNKRKSTSAQHERNLSQVYLDDDLMYEAATDIVAAEEVFPRDVESKNQKSVSEWLSAHLEMASVDWEKCDMSLVDEPGTSRPSLQVSGSESGNATPFERQRLLDRPVVNSDCNQDKEIDPEEFSIATPSEPVARLDLWHHSNQQSSCESGAAKNVHKSHGTSPAHLNGAAKAIQMFWRRHYCRRLSIDSAQKPASIEQHQCPQLSKVSSVAVPTQAARPKRSDSLHRMLQQKSPRIREVDSGEPSTMSRNPAGTNPFQGHAAMKKPFPVQSAKLEYSPQSDYKTKAEDEDFEEACPSEHDTVKYHDNGDGCVRAAGECDNLAGYEQHSDDPQSHVDRILKELHNLDLDEESNERPHSHVESTSRTENIYNGSNRVGGWSDMLTEIHRVLSQSDEEEGRPSHIPSQRARSTFTEPHYRPRGAYQQRGWMVDRHRNIQSASSYGSRYKFSNTFGRQQEEFERFRDNEESKNPLFHSLRQARGSLYTGNQYTFENSSVKSAIIGKPTNVSQRLQFNRGRFGQRSTDHCEQTRSFKDPVERRNERNVDSILRSSMTSTKPNGSTNAQGPADETELAIHSLTVQLEERKCTIRRLQQVLSEQRELSIRQLRDTQKEAEQRAASVKADYEAAIDRQYKLMDQLIDQKKALHSKCEGLINEVRTLTQKGEDKLRVAEDRYKVELRKADAKHAAAEKLRREKWELEKTKQIREATLRGMEAEISQLMANHKDEMQQLRQSCAEQIQAADMRAYQAYNKLIEELKQTLLKDKEDCCTREREAAKLRAEKILEEERSALQCEKLKLMAEISNERQEFATAAVKHQEAMKNLQNIMQSTIAELNECHKKELQESLEEIREEHQREIAKLQKRNEKEWKLREDDIKSTLEAQFATRENKLREEIQRNKDEQTEATVRRFEAATMKAQNDAAQETELKIKRIRDKLTTEISELEQAERQALEKCSQMKARLVDKEHEVEFMQSKLAQRDTDFAEIRKQYDKLNEERSQVSEIVRQEFAERLISIEEENRVAKRDLAELRVRLSRAQEHHDKEIMAIRRANAVDLEAVHHKVKEALQRKEEKLASFRRNYEAELSKRDDDIKRAHERSEHLEELLTEQRKQFLKTTR